tara:strand:- start:2781 stop:2993 length:213 start_codon:yes stop_codon:yes gene_type:complete
LGWASVTEANDGQYLERGNQIEGASKGYNPKLRLKYGDCSDGALIVRTELKMLQKNNSQYSRRQKAKALV